METLGIIDLLRVGIVLVWLIVTAMGLTFQILLHERAGGDLRWVIDHEPDDLVLRATARRHRSRAASHIAIKLLTLALVAPAALLPPPYYLDRKIYDLFGSSILIVIMVLLDLEGWRDLTFRRSLRRY